jgi:hypothetical protein
MSITHKCLIHYGCKNSFFSDGILLPKRGKKGPRPKNSSTFYNGISKGSCVFIALLMCPRIFISLLSLDLSHKCKFVRMGTSPLLCLREISRCSKRLVLCNRAQWWRAGLWSPAHHCLADALSPASLELPWGVGK